MVDVVSPEVRSRMMASIRNRDTKPEMTVRRFLHAQGYRYKLHDRSLPGSPDLVLPKFKLAIFVHGCFFHRHGGCRFATMPSQNREKWITKFGQNVERDARNVELLRATGWRIFVIWECGLRSEQREAGLGVVAELISDMTIPQFEWPLPQLPKFDD